MNDEMQCEEGRGKRWEVCFMQKLLRVKKDKENHYSVTTRNSYCKLVAEAEEGKSVVKEMSLQYQGLESFDVLEIGEVKKLIAKGETMRHFLPAKEIFDVIESAHCLLQ
jgi:hypothetical protein